ncbi:MAG TPA: proton-conducting transporter membrane subunit [Salinimicrobium sp.]|nr:proton-conducting transporter membrane subunit [Salinimicrobium sp.]
MMAQLTTYPILLQLLLGIILMFAWNNVKLQRIISILGSIVGVVVAVVLFISIWNDGTQIVEAGSWPAPFSIVFVADIFAATLVLLTSFAGLAVASFSSATVMPLRLKFGYFPIFHFLLLGLNGAFLTGDLFNLYVWFEIIIISSFVLITIGGEKAQLEGAVKYFTLNILASMIFLTAIAVLYGLSGSLNMADLALKVAQIENRTLVEVTAILFFVGFGIKSAVFPLYFWLPASYHTPPPAVSAIFGGLLTKVGVYALIRVFTLIFPDEVFLRDIFIVVAVLTLFSGAIGALVQNNIRKVFSYLIICHIGFMIAGLGMFTEVAIAGAIFYLIHDIMVKTNLFMISGLIYRLKGSNSIRALGGLYEDFPKISLLIIASFCSLVGLPPFSGFWPKLSLLTEAFKIENYWIVGAILLASFLTLFIIWKLWSEVFWKKSELKTSSSSYLFNHDMKYHRRIQMLAPIIFITIISLYIGFAAENIQVLSERIADELMNPQPYIDAVLNKTEILEL